MRENVEEDENPHDYIYVIVWVLQIVKNTYLLMMRMWVMIVHMQNTWISVIEQLPAADSGGWPGPHAKALGGIILGSISQDLCN